jgi:TrmH family RNA methyltransferase
VKTVSSRQNPVVAMYRAAARGETLGVMLLDGVHLVAEAVAAGLRMRHVAVKTEAMNITEIGLLVDRLEHANAYVDMVSAQVMDALSPVRSSSAVVALADRPSPSEQKVYEGAAPLVILAVDVQDPGNVGAIVRVAEAGGATGFVAAGACADPLGWKALRGSMGSALRLPILVASDPHRAIEDAKRHGCRIVATTARGGQSPFDIDYTGPAAVLIGSEGPGLPPALVEAADERVTIPMQTPVESLNAAVTAALIVYEARRQRTRH